MGWLFQGKSWLWGCGENNFLAKGSFPFSFTSMFKCIHVHSQGSQYMWINGVLTAPTLHFKYSYIYACISNESCGKKYFHKCTHRW